MYGLDDAPVDIAKLKNSLKRNEGVRLKPYVDSVGKISIGIGRNLTDIGITLDEADYLLDNDIKHVLDQVQKEDWWPSVKDNDVRARAMSELVFNMGIYGVRTFRNALTCLKAGDFDGAAKNFLDSKWTSQVGARSDLICKMIETGLD